MDKHIPGFKIANGSSKGRKATDDVKKAKRRHLKFDTSITTPDEGVLPFKYTKYLYKPYMLTSTKISYNQLVSILIL